jgi:glutamate-5-semialdehyde dehydrogenase
METDLHLQAGDRLVVGEKIIALEESFVSQMRPGDKVLAVSSSGTVKRIPAEVVSLVDSAMNRATKAFDELTNVSRDSITRFFELAADFLIDENIARQITSVNQLDVQSARARGRSTTRLEFTEKMRTDMVEAFRMWRDSDVEPESKIGEVSHQGWTVEQWRAPLGVIGFVFEGRPNVFADATGVLRSGNTVVFRIGSDALETAKAIMSLVISPAAEQAGLPSGCVVLLESAEHAAGWCLFSDTRLALAVARGSGEAVAELGSIARQSGVSVSLHGTGGAWMLVGESADIKRLQSVVTHSLDRKVCNTLNVVCVPRSKAAEFVPVIFEAAEVASSKRDAHCRIHAVNGAEVFIPSNFEIDVLRADGVHREKQVTVSSASQLGHEFEWENSPEFFVVLVEDLEEGIDLFNSYSPQFVVSVVSQDESDLTAVWRRCNAPFAGDGFTRWVDGQFALLRPELGLSNWEGGRLFARGGVLSGDSAFTVRLKVRQEDIDLHR